jgi:hypothetical protein
VSGGGLRREMASAVWGGPESSKTGIDAGRLSKCEASFVQGMRVVSHAEWLQWSKLRGSRLRRLLMRVVVPDQSQVVIFTARVAGPLPRTRARISHQH